MTEIDLPQESAPLPGLLARLRDRLPRLKLSSWRVVLIYLAGLTVAEAVTNLVEPRVGLVLHGMVLIALFLHASVTEQSRLRGFLLSLALAPLIRLLSLSLPLPNFPFIYWYMVVGTPLLMAAFAAGRIGRITAKMQGFSLRAMPMQVVIALTGIGLGYLEYIILRPQPLVAELTLEQVWLPALILLIFTGFLEEWIFRGLMQYTAIRNFGRWGFIYVAAVFAILHLGYKSALDVVFVFAVAVFFGWAVLRTGSIAGATVAHGLTNIGLFLVFPFLIGAPVVTPGTVAPTPAVQQPGLLAPVAPTAQATRPFLPPTNTPEPPTPTPEWTVTPLPSETVEWTITPPSQATATVCTPRNEWVPYTVRSGDTLSELSRRYNISVTELMQANCMTTTALVAGQTLYVPYVVPTTSPTASPSPTRTPSPPVISSAVPTSTWTATPTHTASPLPTDTETPVPSDTPSVTPSDTPTPSETPSPTPSDTPVPSETPAL